MKQLIKSVLNPRGNFYRSLAGMYYYWRPPVRTIPRILQNFNALQGSVKFIQVGSNDGVSGDPISKYIQSGRWTGVLVEPVKYLFERLKKNYAPFATNLAFENVAIAREKGVFTFYRLNTDNRPDLPRWYEQLGSFNKEVVLSSKTEIPNIEELMMEEKVSAITFSELISKHDLQFVQLIHIDTEGYDYELIKLLDFTKIRPKLLLFEHKHLSHKDYVECLQLLKRVGYRCVYFGSDTMAIDNIFLAAHPEVLAGS